VLVGGAFVAVDGDALVDDVAIQVFFFAEGFHHQLLQVAGKQQQAVFVGQHHHVFFALAVARVVPGQGQQGGGVLLEIGNAGGGIHFLGPRQHGANVDVLQGSGQQPHGRQFRGAASHPVAHGEGPPASLPCAPAFHFAADPVMATA
jgi:hypothetical protein